MDIQILTRLCTTEIVHEKGASLFNTFMIEICYGPAIGSYLLVAIYSFDVKFINIYNRFYLIKIVQNVHLIQNLIFTVNF